MTLVGSVAASTAVSGSLSYTYTRSQRSNVLAGGYDAIAGIPANQVDAFVDVHPTGLPFGVMLTVNGVGELFNTVSGFGSVTSGDYVVADLSGRVFFDAQRRHRINLRLENLFDNRYTTANARGFPDASSTPFLVHHLGTPRTLHVSYSFSY